MTEVRMWNFGERNNHAVMWTIPHPKAVLQIVHGMIEHIERYDEFARFANQAGYLVVGHDHVGHGNTVVEPADYGHFSKDWQTLVADVHTLQVEVKQKYPNIPYIIMGTGQQLRVQTWTEIGLTRILRAIHGEKYRSKFLEQMSTGMFNRSFSPNRTKADWLSRDEAEVDKYLAHEHHKFTPTLNMYHSLFTFSMKIGGNPPTLVGEG